VRYKNTIRQRNYRNSRKERNGDFSRRTIMKITKYYAR
jgi:hypothetical protein